jgi:hypothetical protein
MYTLALLLMASATGCAGSGLFQNWLHPGPMQQQRYRATLFDPYSAPDLGPSVDGGRPRDYRPAPEPVRNRYFNGLWGR